MYNKKNFKKKRAVKKNMDQKKIDLLNGNLSINKTYSFLTKNNDIIGLTLWKKNNPDGFSLSRIELERLFDIYFNSIMKTDVRDCKISDLINVGALIDLKDNFCEKNSIPHDIITKFISHIVDNCLTKNWKELI